MPIDKNKVVRKKIVEEADSATPAAEEDVFGLDRSDMLSPKGEKSMPRAIAPAPENTNEMHIMAPQGEAPLMPQGS